MLYDFHTHTFLSDGVLSPIELIRRCIVNGYTALGISDHCGASTLERIVAEVAKDAELAARHWDFQVFAGVELTHVPAASIPELAALAKKCGASHVVVHGETPVEPVEPGTNLSAASCPDVDVLAHPGLLSAEAAEAATENGVFIEITAKDGHSLGNGHVARVAKAAGAKLVVDSDSHVPGQILTPDFQRRVALCAGLSEEDLDEVLVRHPQELVARILRRQAEQ